MTARTLTLLAAAALGVTGIATAQMGGQAGQGAQPAQPRQQQQQQQPGQMGQAAPAGAQMPGQQQGQLTDKQFVDQAASSGHFEVEAAKLAQDKASDPQIKQLAKTMESDHQQVNDDLKKAAQQANIDVPGSPQGKDQQMLSQLKQASDQQIGQQYLQQAIQAHRNAIQLYQRAETQLQDPQLKQFAQQTLPKLQQHLQHLEQVQQQAQPAGGQLQGQGMQREQQPGQGMNEQQEK